MIILTGTERPARIAGGDQRAAKVQQPDRLLPIAINRYGTTSRSKDLGVAPL